MQTFTSAADLEAAAGTELGASDWLVVEQDRINRFADATDDHQWIHVDLERAAGGPFGAPIAHGYLTLSLLPRLGRDIFSVPTATGVINIGLNRVRFIHPVRVGSKIRSVATLESVNPVSGGVQVVIGHTIEVEIEGKPRPACVAETVSRVLFATD